MKLVTRIQKALDNRALEAAWAISDMEMRKGVVVFRLPEGELFDNLWHVIEKCAEDSPVEVKRGAKWPNVTELDEVLGSVKWLWYKWIPVGFLTMLVGSPGTGKSLVALDWVRCITLPCEWPLSEDAPKQGCVAWVETESSQQLLNARCKTIKVPRERVLLPAFGSDLLGQPDLMLDRDRERLISMVDYIKPTLVVIDSLGGAHRKGENKVEEVRPMLDFLAKMSRDKDIATLAIHHLRKRGANESADISLDRIRGSTAFSAFARSIIAIDQTKMGVLSVEVIKSNLARKPHRINAKIRENKDEQPIRLVYTEYKAPPPKLTKKERCANWVYAHLVHHGKVVFANLVEAAEEQGYSRSMLYDCRSELGDTIHIGGDGRKSTWEIYNG